MPLKVNLTGVWPAGPKAAVKAAVKALRQTVPLSAEGNINIELVDDERISDLNKQYSGNAYPTDVLSFSYVEDQLHGDEVGDIAVNLAAASRQAKAAGAGEADEVALLSVHGILHLLGYDHRDASGRQEVDRLQRQILHRADLKYREFSWED